MELKRDGDGMISHIKGGQEGIGWACNCKVLTRYTEIIKTAAVHSMISESLSCSLNTISFHRSRLRDSQRRNGLKCTSTTLLVVEEILQLAAEMNKIASCRIYSGRQLFNTHLIQRIYKGRMGQWTVAEC